MWGNVQNFAITNMWRNTLLVVVINRNCFHNHHCHHRKQRRQHQYIHFLLFLVCQLCLHHSALSRVVKKTNVTEETQERLSIHICASLINTKAGADVRAYADKSILFIPLSSSSPTDLLAPLDPVYASGALVVGGVRRISIHPSIRRQL